MNNHLHGELLTPVRKLMFLKAFTGDNLTEYTITGNPASFETNVAKALTGFTIPFTPTQSGSGDPSPENIRPISGWTGLNVYQSGINIIDVSNIEFTSSKYIKWADGTLGSWGSSWKASDYVPIKGGENYVFKCHVSGIDDAGVAFYDASKTYISGTKTNLSSYVYSLSAPQNAKYMRFSCTNTSDNLMLEFGTTSSAYEAYSGDVFTETFGETVFGGHLDMLTGKLYAEWDEIASYNGETLPGKWISDRDVYAPGTTPTTGAQVVYELATPQTFQLSGLTVPAALIGDNVIWTDTNGSNEIKYLKKG